MNEGSPAARERRQGHALGGWSIAIPIVAFFASFAVSIWSISAHFEGGLSHEFCNYAEIGRNLTEGRGLRTRMVYPSTLALLDQRAVAFTGLAPVLDRFPLQAVLTAGAERLAGDRDGAVLGLSALCLAALAALTSAAGLALFGPWEAALAGAFVALDPAFQRGFVLWGLPDFGFAVLVLALTWLLAAPDELKTARTAAAGAVAGLAWLQRSNLLLWLPIFAWKLGRGKGGARRLLEFFGAACLVSLPALLYNRRWYGSMTPPTFAWNLAHHVLVDTPPWLQYRVFTAPEALAHPSELSRKFLYYLWLHARELHGWWAMRLVFPVAVLGAWSVERDRRRRPRDWARLCGLMLVTQIVAFSFLRFELLGPWVGGRYYLWAAPTLFLLAAHAAAHLGKGAGFPLAAPLLFAAANLTLFLHGLLGPQGAPAHPAALRVDAWPEMTVLRSLPEDCIVATNLPAQAAWYARRSAVALPAEPEDLLRIDARHPMDAVLVSTLTAAEPYNTPAWAALMADRRALAAFAVRGRWVVRRDFGTSVLLTREKAGL